MALILGAVVAASGWLLMAIGAMPPRRCDGGEGRGGGGRGRGGGDWDTARFHTGLPPQAAEVWNPLDQRYFPGEPRFRDVRGSTVTQVRVDGSDGAASGSQWRSEGGERSWWGSGLNFALRCVLRFALRFRLEPRRPDLRTHPDKRSGSSLVDVVALDR